MLLRLVASVGAVVLGLKALQGSFLEPAVPATSIQVWVDCTAGSDNGSGTAAAPFRTLLRARDFVRALPRPLSTPVIVSVGGTCYPRPVGGAGYDFSSPVLTLDNPALDSGAPGTPVTWRAAPGALLSGGLPLPGAQAWEPYTAAPGCFRLDLKTVQGYDPAFGLGSLVAGSLGHCANSKAELFDGGAPTTRARYPNQGPNGEWRWLQSSGVNQTGGGSITLNDERPLHRRWAMDGNNAFLHGMWKYDWADSHVRLAGVTPCPGDKPNCSVLELDPSTHPVYELEKGCRFLAEDLLEELDAPGESYVDANNHAVYYCPPGGALMQADGHYHLGMAWNVLHLAGKDAALKASRTVERTGLEFLNGPASLHVGAGPSHAATSYLQFVNFVGFGLSHSRGPALSSSSIANMTMDSLVVSAVGSQGMSLTNAWGVSVRNATVQGTGCAGMSVSGGDTKTLAHANTKVFGSRISNFARVTRTYQPGISWFGAGLTFTHNEIFNGPHSGILGSGNDCLFDSNYLHDLCYEVSDAGAWYSGRSWTRRGNVLRNNTFSRIVNTEKTVLGSPAVQAIYFDDELSEQSAINNTITDSYAGILLGGGRDNLIIGNRFINMTSGYAVTFDNRGMNWQAPFCLYNKSTPTASGLLVTGLFDVHHTQPPYSTAYPRLPHLLDNSPCLPVGNVLANNTYCVAEKGFLNHDASTVTSWKSLAYNNKLAC